MGLAPGPGRRTLVIANGSDDEVRADIRVVTDRSVFAPEGLPEIRIAPHSVQRIALSSVLGRRSPTARPACSSTSTGPVTATVRSYVAGDLSHAVPSDVVEESATVLLPEGGESVDKTVELAGATRHGRGHRRRPLGVGGGARPDPRRDLARPRGHRAAAGRRRPGDGHRRAHLGGRARC